MNLNTKIKRGMQIGVMALALASQAGNYAEPAKDNSDNYTKITFERKVKNPAPRRVVYGEPTLMVYFPRNANITDIITVYYGMKKTEYTKNWSFNVDNCNCQEIYGSEIQGGEGIDERDSLFRTKTKKPTQGTKTKFDQILEKYFGGLKNARCVSKYIHLYGNSFQKDYAVAEFKETVTLRNGKTK
jgi:hypothetical protein